MNYLKNIKISTKISIGFGLLIVLLLVIATLGSLSLINADNNFKKYRSLARQTNAEGRVQANMLMTRLFVKNFVIDANEDNIEGVKKRAEKTLELIAEARILSNDRVFGLMIDDLHSELKEYLKHFDEITKKQALRNTLVNDVLNIIGPQMEKSLTAIMQSAFKDGDTEAAYRAGISMRHLLLARLYAGRFLIQNDNASYERVRLEFVGMNESLDRLLANLKNPNRREIATTVRQDQRRYFKAFTDVHDVIIARNGIIKGQLDRIGPKVADKIERLKLTLKDEQDILGPKAEASIDRAVIVTITVSAISILMGIIAVWTLGFGVSRPILAMTNTMKELAAGNTDVNIPYSNRNDEVGEMANSVNVFKKNMAEVRAAEEQFRNLLESTPDPLLIVDPNGVIVLTNQQTVNMFGYSKDELEGKPVENLMPEHFRKSHPQQRQGFHDNPKAREMGKSMALFGLHKNGTEIPIEVSLNPFLTDGKSLVAASVRDVSARRKTENDLKMARTSAEAATESKAIFLASMSHEIRTPMNGVIGMVDLLRQTELDSDQKQMLQTISSSGQSLLTIINDILDFSKIEAGKLDLETVPFSLTAVVESSSQVIASNAKYKNTRLINYVDPNLPQFLAGDPVRIRQILINLGGNAVKFTEKGDVVVRAEQCKTEDGDKIGVRFSVTDNGIGISEEAQEKLFEAFSQAESSTTRQFGGTGLGLSICKKLTEMMGGEIGVKSQLGEGSEFYVTLSFQSSNKALENEQQQDMAGLRILLIVDNNVEQAILKNYLEHWHAQVVTKMDLTTCIQECKKAAKEGKPFDVVVMGPQWSREEQFSLRDDASKEKALAGTKFVSLLTGDRQRARLDSPESVCLDVNPLHRAAFLSAVAIAAGRASPEVHYEETVEDLKTVGKAPTVEEARVLGTLILVAEDNFTNRDVIGRQLKLLGYACEMAEDGKLALDAWRDNDYGILLTDCHMPNMDGFELTDTIRNEERTSNERTPIIAITANALEGEAERCLAAGMDDYMSKPIDMKELREKLHKWMPQLNETVVKVADVDCSETALEKVDGPIDKNALQAMFGDDEDLYKEILHDFISPSKSIIGEINTGLEQRSTEAVKQAAHKLKSSAASIGAIKLAELCNTLEQAGKTDDWDIIEAGAPKLYPLMNEIENYIIRL